jgi:hypothetical protein
MRSSRLSEREVDDVLAGRRPDGRARPDGLDKLVAVLHASREVEPAPPMSEELRAAIAEGAGTEAAGPIGSVPATPVVVASAYRQAVARGRAGSFARPAMSVAAAAVLLVGLVLAATRLPLDRSDSEAASQLGSAVGGQMRAPEDGGRLPGVAGSDAATRPRGPTIPAPVPSGPAEGRPTVTGPAEAPPAAGDTTGTSTSTTTATTLDEGRDDHRGGDRDRDGDADGSGGGPGGTFDAGETRTWSQPGTWSTVDPAGEPTPATSRPPATGGRTGDEPEDATTPPSTVEPEAGTTADPDSTTSTTAPAPVAPEG